jgi:hypothetical protein
MAITLIRVINQQKINRSILLDKLDDGQANTTGYAYKARNMVYVPYSKTTDSAGLALPSAVKGYVDLVPSDRVLLSAANGTISGLATSTHISTFAFSSALKKTSVISSATHSGVTNDTTIGGTTFFSVTPDVTYVVFQAPGGATQTVPSSAFASFSTTQIVIDDSTITIGVPGAGWKVTVRANSSSSNTYTI